MTLHRLFWIAAAVFIQCMTSAAPASALSCSANTTLAFGVISLLGGGGITTTGTVAITCVGLPGNVLRACPSIGPGSGGAAAGGGRRRLTGPVGGQIDYNLYSDSGFSTIWGSVSGVMSSYPPPFADITIGLGGTGSGSLPIYAQIFPLQQGAAAGIYTSAFAGLADFSVASASAIGGPSCLTIAASNATAGTASVTANYLASCTIAASPLAFGSLTSTLAAVDQSTTIQTQCSGSTPFTLSLNGGLTGTTDPTAREMQHGIDRLRYGLYRDAGYAQPWGSTIGSNVFTSTGSGASQAIQVYGRIQPQTTPPSGNYTDTVIVTIDY
jgi:spore coat protein U-like protein